jgi:hypothetical protein
MGEILEVRRRLIAGAGWVGLSPTIAEKETDFLPQKAQRDAGCGGGCMAPIGAMKTWPEQERLLGLFVAKIPGLGVLSPLKRSP